MIELFESFLTTVHFDFLTEVESKSAYVWILGEFGEQLPLAPYIIERMVKANAEEPSTQVGISLLTTLVKLFFSRPVEVKKQLGEFFKFAIEETIDVDLKDRAAFYYKLLKMDPLKAQAIIIGERSDVSFFYEDKDQSLLEKLSIEFNTLSIIYNKPQEKFLKEDVLKTYRKAQKAQGHNAPAHMNETAPEPAEEEEEVEVQKPEEDLIDFGDPVVESDNLAAFDPLSEVMPPPTFVPDAQQADPLGLIEETNPIAQNTLLDMGGPSTIPMEMFTQPQPAVPTLNLNASASLEPPVFQQKFLSLPARVAILGPAINLPIEAAQAKFLEHKVFTLASGGLPQGGYKMFLFVEHDGTNTLFELTNTPAGSSYVMKTDRPDLAGLLDNHISKVFI